MVGKLGFWVGWATYRGGVGGNFMSEMGWNGEMTFFRITGIHKEIMTIELMFGCQLCYYLLVLLTIDNQSEYVLEVVYIYELTARLYL